MSEPRLRVISLGAGVQSTAMALLAAHKIIGPMPDCAIFADTGWEPKAVYEHLEWLKPLLPFPVWTVSAGDLRSDTLARSNTTGGRFAAIPWFTLSPRGKPGMGRRQCTSEYKLKPIHRKVVELLGGRPKGGCEMWIGISTDEAMRRRDSRVQYITNRWPLIERGMSRSDCQGWLLAMYDRAAPKSACIGCPFHSNDQWRSLSPAEFADAVEVDLAIRHQPGSLAAQFMHPSRKPLQEVDFSTAEDRGQLNLFLNECSGLCNT